MLVAAGSVELLSTSISSFSSAFSGRRLEFFLYLYRDFEFFLHIVNGGGLSPAFLIDLVIWEFFISTSADGLSMMFEWLQVSSRTFLRIQGELNKSVVWMVSTRFRIFKPPSPFNNPLLPVPRAPITSGIIVIFVSIYSLR